MFVNHGFAVEWPTQTTLSWISCMKSIKIKVCKFELFAVVQLIIQTNAQVYYMEILLLISASIVL